MRDHPPDRTPQPARGDRTVPPAAPTGPGAHADRRLPRLGAKALVTARGRVLLIEERHADGSAFWTLPGGGVEAGESFPECLRRELEEEIRCRAAVGEAVGSYVYRHTSRSATTVYAVLDATLQAAPDPNHAESVTDHAWWEPTELPANALDPVERFLERVLTDGGADR